MTSSLSNKKNTLSLWNPFSGSSIGFPEILIPTSHSRPHINALKILSREKGWNCYVDYLTEKRFPFVHKDELTWRFWPYSFRLLKKNHRWRNQWSLLALASLLRASPD